MKHFHLPSVVLAGLLASASSGRANEIVDSFRVADGYAVKNAVKEGLVANPGFAGFDDLGRLFVTESIAGDTADERRGRIRILEDTDGTGGFDSSLVFAADLPELGGVLSLGANTYATTPTGLIRFSDADRDGIADKQETLLTGWTARGSERLHGPFRGPDGWLYLTQGRAGFEIKTSEGFGFEGRAARVWRFRPDGTGLAVIAGGGFSNPGELVFTSSGEVIGTVSYVTEPAYGERDGLVHFVEGGVYGLNGPVVQEFKTTGDLLGALSSLASVSPAGLLRYEGTQFGVDAVGHLFSAQTEAGRIQRHQLTRTNATYTSDDSDFLVSANGGFQPRDVVETPTGSLLVIDGGTIGSSAGGIYEVSLIGAVPTDEKNRGRRAIRNLISQLSRARSSEERNDALWQIHRAGGKKSQETIRAAFDDRSVDVRIAAVMSAGLSGDVDALGQLHEMIAAEKDASVRRAIATALGRIGEVKSNGRLIRAAGREIPRFEEHAIIHSLNRVYGRMTNSSFKYTAPQIGRLPSGSARAALIAFEQMTPNPLRPEHILPLFDISNGDMQRAAGWVFNRHPEWITNIVGHLHKKLLQYSLNEAELASMKELFEEFSGTRVMQDLMADAYSNVRLEEDRRKMLFDVMRNAEVNPVPGKWIGALKLALISEDDFTRTAAFEMIERHNLAGFEDFIAQTAEVDKRDDIRFRAFTLLAKWGEL
jgi:glucose/arabinose dehydrogenase